MKKVIESWRKWNGISEDNKNSTFLHANTMFEFAKHYHNEQLILLNSCQKLKEKEVISFKDWKIQNYAYLFHRHFSRIDGKFYSTKQLSQKYKDEILNL